MNVIRSAAVLVVTALLAAACSSGEDAAPANSVPPATEAVETTSTTTTTSTITSTTTSTTTTSTTTSTTTAAPLQGTDEEQIEALVEQYWRTLFVEAYDPPDPSPEVWARVATPGLRTVLANTVQSRIENGEGVIGLNLDKPFVAAIQVTVIDSFAIVFMCLRDEARLYDLETGETVREARGLSHKRMEALNGVDGWLVDSSETLENFDAGEVAACTDALS